MKAYMIWNGGPTMELTDRVFIMKELTSSEGQTAIKAMTGAEAYNHFLTLACSAPAIDPIRAAGGCRCGECKKYHDGTGWCEEHSYFCDSEGIPCSPAESMEWKIFQEREYCSKSEPREAQGDGKENP